MIRLFLYIMEIKNNKSVSDNLSKYDIYVNKDSANDFIEITQWQNQEGYTIMFADRVIMLSEGELDAINHLVNVLRFEK